MTRNELTWLDYSKGTAILWIFLNHVSEQILGFPLVANPSGDWPPFAERLAQLRWMDGFDFGSIGWNLLRYVGWFGDQGVGLFLVLSGFGLTWGLLERREDVPILWSRFYHRRAERVFPLWWTAHFVFMGSWLVVGYGLSVTDPRTYLSLVGLRITPALFYYFTPAWWYIGLLVQLYLVYPVLWHFVRARGRLWMLVTTCCIAFGLRLVGLLSFDQFLSYWALGAIFVTRLPEFALGIFLAAMLHADPTRVDVLLRSRTSILLAVTAFTTGVGLSLTLVGMTFAPCLMAGGVLVLLYSAFRFCTSTPHPYLRFLAWSGEHSYSLYLAHHPVVAVLLPRRTPLHPSVWLRIVAAALVSAALALVLEKLSGPGLAWVRQRMQGLGPRRTVGALLGAAIAAVSVLLGVELLVSRLAPQEVLGWGERPSLEPHSTFGWRLRPSRTTRLRWESYDYTVTANSLGFPGPEYSTEKRPGTFRALTIGDAFTSAEGVDTQEAWPRLLESELARRLPQRRVEVLNFGITGYGPNEYAAVAEAFVPTFRPDLVIVQFFVNEYEDVLHGPEFVGSIGFELPSPESTFALVRLTQLRHTLRTWLKAPMVSLLRGTPEPYGYFLGNFSSLERRDNPQDRTARALVETRLRQIRAAADAVAAPVLLLLVPAPVQVCTADDLGYYPHHADLSDSARFDVERPQRITKAIADRLHFRIVDLRTILARRPGSCPYRRWNMHWTVEAHRHVASSLAELLAKDAVPATTEVGS
jgi:peptidoglycan/LPS O-acetylase OafA/YrhL/lysophospholipase L1-like esterase